MLLVMAIALTLIISGCTTSSNTSSNNTNNKTTNDTGSTTMGAPGNFSVVEMAYGEAASLDPASSDSYDSASQEVIQNVYETLFYFNGSDINTPIPVLATGYNASPDNLVYTITLRPNIKFHSGDPMNATAVKYSLDRLLLVNNGQASSNFLGTVKGYTDYSNSNHTQADVDAYLKAGGVTVLNDTAVQITLEKPNPDFIKMLTFCACSIINPNFDQAHGGYNATGQTGTAYLTEHEDGTGPFILDHWNHKQEVALKRNDNYWGTKALPSMAYIKEVDDWNTRLLAIQNGDADIVNVDQKNAPDVMNDTNLVVESKYGRLYVLTTCYDQRYWPFNDQRVREAFSESIDYNTYINSQLNGLGQRIGGPIPQGLLGYDTNAKLVPFDPDHAKKLLQDAGFSKSNATTITITYNTGNDNRKTLAQMMKSQIESYDLGITVNVQDMAWPEYTKAMDQSQLPCYIVAWGADYPSTDNFVSCYLAPNGYYTQQIAYKNDSVFALYNQTLTEKDPAKRGDLYKQIQADSFSDYPYSYVYQPSEFLVYKKGLNGVYWNTMTGGEGVLFSTVYK